MKVAESGEDRRRLGREASTLRNVAHPGVVRVAAVEGGEALEGPERLALHRVVGSTLADVGPCQAAVVAGWGAAIATVLADLHDLGYAHRRVTPDHVLIDEHGRPVLCGFAAASRPDTSSGREEMEADIRDLARMLHDLLEPGQEAVRPLLTRWMQGRHRHAGEGRALAAALVGAVPDASVAPPNPPSGPPRVQARGATGAQEPRDRWKRSLGRRLGGHRRAASIAVGAVFCGLLTAVAVSWHGQGRPSTHPAGASRGVSFYLLRSFPGERPMAVLGRWGCGPARPAVLDARSGTIWAFPSWPSAGAAVSARVVARVPSADGLAVVSANPGCDRLLVLRAGQPDLALNVGAGG